MTLVLAAACASGDTAEQVSAASDSAAAATATAAPPPPPTPFLDVGETMQFIGSGRLWVRVRGLGAGKPLVLVHGAPGTGSQALKPLEALAEDRLTARYDLLGTGKSDALPDTALINIRRAVDDLEGLRRLLKVESWHVLGHSYGAAIAIEYARQRPGRVASVVLIDPLLRGANDSTHSLAALPTLADSALQQTYAADFDSLRTMKGAEIGDQLRREAVDTASRAFAPDSVGRLLKAALIPAMVVSGANDAGGTKSARAIAAAMPKAKLIVYPRTGLFTAWEQKERLISDVRAFLKSLDKPPR